MTIVAAITKTVLPHSQSVEVTAVVVTNEAVVEAGSVEVIVVVGAVASVEVDVVAVDAAETTPAHATLTTRGISQRRNKHESF